MRTGKEMRIPSGKRVLDKGCYVTVSCDMLAETSSRRNFGLKLDYCFLSYM